MFKGTVVNLTFNSSHVYSLELTSSCFFGEKKIPEYYNFKIFVVSFLKLICLFKSDDEAYHCSLTPFIGKGNSSNGGGVSSSEEGKIPDTKVDTESSDKSWMNKVKSEVGEGDEGGVEGEGEGGEEGGGYDLDDIDAVLNDDKPKTLFSEGGLLEEIR